MTENPNRRAARHEQEKKNPFGWITVIAMVMLSTVLEMLLGVQ